MSPSARLLMLLEKARFVGLRCHFVRQPAGHIADGRGGRLVAEKIRRGTEGMRLKWGLEGWPTVFWHSMELLTFLTGDTQAELYHA